MDGLFNGWPYPLAVTALTLIAFCRGGLTYVVGRVISDSAKRTRIQKVIHSHGFKRATDALNRWGPPVVSLCFLTFGFQTLVNLAAGVSHMPPRRYVPALGVGALLWGFFYATVGFVTFAAWFHLYDRWPMVAVLLFVLVVGGIAAFVITQVLGLNRSSDEGAAAVQAADESAADDEATTQQVDQSAAEVRDLETP